MKTLTTYLSCVSLLLMCISTRGSAWYVTHVGSGGGGDWAEGDGWHIEWSQDSNLLQAEDYAMARAWGNGASPSGTADPGELSVIEYTSGDPGPCAEQPAYYRVGARPQLYMYTHIVPGDGEVSCGASMSYGILVSAGVPLIDKQFIASVEMTHSEDHSYTRSFSCSDPNFPSSTVSGYTTATRYGLNFYGFSASGTYTAGNFSVYMHYDLRAHAGTSGAEVDSYCRAEANIYDPVCHISQQPFF